MLVSRSFTHPLFCTILFIEARPSQINVGTPDFGVFPLFILRSVSDCRAGPKELVFPQPGVPVSEEGLQAHLCAI